MWFEANRFGRECELADDVQLKALVRIELDSDSLFDLVREVRNGDRSISHGWLMNGERWGRRHPIPKPIFLPHGNGNLRSTRTSETL